VLHITTQASKQFSIVGFMYEDIFDLKKRIETIEGIPVLD
jgi:hypothetical protein